MNRKELETYIAETYHGESDHPWIKDPNYEVFRHCSNQKWFALIMDIPKNKLGFHNDEVLDVVNVKCEPILIDSLRTKDGFFPAYHMNKTNWITVALDGTVPDEMLKMLLDMSFRLTAPKIKKEGFRL